MPTKLYYNKLQPAGVTATNAQANYPATNLLLDSVARPWKATSAGAIDLIFDMGSSQALGGILLHDVNFASATVATSPDNVTYTAAGTMSCAGNKFGRTRGLLSLSGITARYIKVTIAAGTPLFAEATWRAGAAHIMKTLLTLAQAPNKGYSVTTNFPQEKVTLANKRLSVASTGLPFDVISWQFLRKYQDSLDIFMQQLRAGTVLIDMGLPQFPQHVWPVTTYDDTHAQTYPKANSESSAVTLMEVA